MVHVTGQWSAALALSSTRICRYEAINGQNLHGWYVGDGVLYTFLSGEQGHYSDAYWPTVDASLLPGTTEQAGPPPALLVNPPATTTAFAGGARFDAGYGGYGLDFVSQDGTVSGRKSWFFTPDAVICLGAGINGTSGYAVRTTIENRSIEDSGLLVDGRSAPNTLGQTVVRPARWLHLDKVAGYVLLDDSPPPVTLLREDRTGTWLSTDTGANTHGTNVPYTRRYQKIVLDHGVNPSGARYAYAVLPGAPAWRTSEARRDWRVLANTAQVQAALLDHDLDLAGASFFAAGTVDPVTVSGPACVLWGSGRGRGAGPDGWTIAVCDPTQTQNTIRLTFDRPGYTIATADPTVTIVATGPRLVVDIAVAGTLGATKTLTITRTR
jgi:hyaluronate lyase